MTHMQGCRLLSDEMRPQQGIKAIAEQTGTNRCDRMDVVPICACVMRTVEHVTGVGHGCCCMFGS